MGLWQRITRAMNEPPARPVPLPPAVLQGEGHSHASPSAFSSTRVNVFTICHHPACSRGSEPLAAALRRESIGLGLDTEFRQALTICEGTCAEGPFLGMPRLGLFYAGLLPEEARVMLSEICGRGRLLHHRLRLEPTMVTDSRLLFDERQGLLVAMESDYCLLGLVAYLFRFNAAESCGKCVPCRLGVHEIDRLLTKLMGGQAGQDDLRRLEDLILTLAESAYCRFGQSITAGLRLIQAAAPGELERHLAHGCAANERFLWTEGEAT